MLKSKKFLSLLMALIMVITIMPLGMITSFAANKFDIYLNGEYYSLVGTLLPGVSYINDEVVLTNADINSIYSPNPLTIKVSGNSTIRPYAPIKIGETTTNVYAGIYCDDDLRIYSDNGSKLTISQSASGANSDRTYSGIYAKDKNVEISGDATVSVITSLGDGSFAAVSNIFAKSIVVNQSASLDSIVNYSVPTSGNVTNPIYCLNISGSRDLESGNVPVYIETEGYVNLEINSTTPNRLTNQYSTCVNTDIDLACLSFGALYMKTDVKSCVPNGNYNAKNVYASEFGDMDYREEPVEKYYNVAGDYKGTRYVAIGKQYEGEQILGKEIFDAFGYVTANKELPNNISSDKFDMEIKWTNIATNNTIGTGNPAGATATINLFPKAGYTLTEELDVGDFYYSTAVSYEMQGLPHLNSALCFAVRFTPTVSTKPEIETPYKLDKSSFKCSDDITVTAQYTLPDGITDDYIYFEWYYYDAESESEYLLSNLDGHMGASVKGLGTKTITISNYNKNTNDIKFDELQYLISVLGHNRYPHNTSVPIEITHENFVYTINADDHTATCECGYSSNEAHSFGTSWAYDENGHYHLCACGSKKDVTEHELTKKYDDTKHWDECLCGFTESKYDHTLGDYIVTKPATETETGLKHKECANCDYKTADEVIEKIPAGHTHSYGDTFEKDANNHWKSCSCGEIKDKEAHSLKTVIDKEATATELGVKHDVCTVCGFETAKIHYGAHSHTFSDEWKTNKDAHYHECSCGERKDEAGHVFEAAENGKEKCTTCGYERDAQAITIIKGDINGDGKVTATDARIALRIGTKLEKLEDQIVPHMEAVDVNGDGKITATDARKILRAATKLEPLT